LCVRKKFYDLVGKKLLRDNENHKKKEESRWKMKFEGVGNGLGRRIEICGEI
jgi:hypothetical protein